MMMMMIMAAVAVVVIVVIIMKLCLCIHISGKAGYDRVTLQLKRCNNFVSYGFRWIRTCDYI